MRSSELPETVFVDRDGVINEDSEHFIKNLQEWKPIPGSIQALAHLSQAGIKVIIITNQSGIARGLFSEKTLEEMHAQLRTDVQAQGGKITDIFYCPHGPNDQCACRKPLPGLLYQAQKKYALDLKKSWCVGDAYRDLEAGRAAHTHPALVLTGKGTQTLQEHPELKNQIPIFKNLAAFTKWLLKEGE